MTVAESDGTVPTAEHTKMPPLTLEATGTTGTSGTERREPTTSSAPERERSEDSSAPEPTQRDSAGDAGSEFSPAPRTSASRSTTPQDRSREQPGERPPEGRETAQLYPDLTVKTLAPTVDVTHREQRRDITHRSEPDRQSAGATRGGLDELVSGDGPERSKYPSDVDRIVEKLYREIERKSRIERERRGL